MDTGQDRKGQDSTGQDRTGQLTSLNILRAGQPSRDSEESAGRGVRSKEQSWTHITSPTVVCLAGEVTINGRYTMKTLS